MITLIPFSQNHISYIINQSEINLEKLSSIIIPDSRIRILQWKMDGI